MLDAKSSTQKDLDVHERQIRRYVDQRQLDFGLLFNLREIRRGARGHEADLSVRLLPLWQAARGEAMVDAAEMERLVRLRERFGHRRLSLAQKVERIRTARPWLERAARGERVEIDLDFLVDRLRDLSRELAENAAAQQDALLRQLALSPVRERALVRELELIALDLAPGTEIPGPPEGRGRVPPRGGPHRAGVAAVPAARLAARPHPHPPVPLLGGRRVRGGLPLRRRLRRGLRAHGGEPAASAARDAPDLPVERLADRWYVVQGIQTGADAYSARIQRRLPAEVRARLAAAGARTGDPILELQPGVEREPPWRDHPEVLARSAEPRALLCGAIDDDDYTSLVWLGRTEHAPEAVVAALDPWRDEMGEWQPSIKTTVCTARESGLSVAYLCGLLNSGAPRPLVRRARTNPVARPAGLRAQADGRDPVPPRRPS